MKLRVLTWNIHGGVGLEGRYDLGRILSVLHRLRPDLAALQEVEGRGRPGAFAALQEACGGHAVRAVTLSDTRGAYGHMLASRFPIVAAGEHDLSVPGREPRRAIAATLDLPSGRLGVLAAHLGLSARERRRQAERLAELAGTTADPLLLLGDFNDWSLRTPIRRRLASVLPASTSLRSFPTALPLLALDRIFARPAGILGAARVDRAIRGSSDHLPLLAEIEL